MWGHCQELNRRDPSLVSRVEPVCISPAIEVKTPQNLTGVCKGLANVKLALPPFLPGFFNIRYFFPKVTSYLQREPESLKTEIDWGRQ